MAVSIALDFGVCFVVVVVCLFLFWVTVVDVAFVVVDAVVCLLAFCLLACLLACLLVCFTISESKLSFLVF